MNQKFCYLLVVVSALRASGATAETESANAVDSKKVTKSSEERFDETKLQGTWKVIDARFDGKKSERSIGVEYTFSKGMLLIRRPNRKVPQTHKYEFSAKQDPPHLDALLNILGMERRTKGIVRLQDGKLTWCWAGSAFPRPTKFKAETKGQTVYVLERVKNKNVAGES